MNDNNQRYIYIVISQTQTKFAKMIRRFGSVDYNHSALGLDPQLTHLFAFARPFHHGIFLGHLVKENLERYTLRQDQPVPVVIFRLPVTVKEYENVRKTIHQISEDPDYIYNLFSVLTYPVFHGISRRKSFTCIEFVAYILKGLGYPMDDKLCSYKPDDLLQILGPQEIYRGDFRDYMISQTSDDTYFESFSIHVFYQNMLGMAKIVKRSWPRAYVFRRRAKKYLRPLVSNPPIRFVLKTIRQKL